MNMANVSLATSALERLAERPDRMKRLGGKLKLGSLFAAAPLLVLLIGFLVVPLSYIVWRSFEGTKLNFAHYERVFASTASLNILVQTLRVGLIVTVLSIVFDRLYVLRNQLVHGGATWNSQVNRQQLRDGVAILGTLVPLIEMAASCESSDASVETWRLIRPSASTTGVKLREIPNFLN